MVGKSLDIEALRGLLAGLSLGSFAKAADYLGRSNSALSAQLQKLETQAGVPLLQKSGRHLIPTAAGEIMIGYGRRLIALNDEALAAVRGGDLAGSVRLGVQEDFETLLPPVLAAFSRAHPKVRIEVRVARNRDLMDRDRAGLLDLALTWGDEDHDAQSLGELPMRWIVRREDLGRPAAAHGALISFEPPCLFRSAGLKALDAAGLAWREPFLSASLGGLWAAAEAGLGVTLRTAIGLPPNLTVIPEHRPDWPVLPKIGLRLHRSGIGSAADHLEEVLREAARGAIARAA